MREILFRGKAIDNKNWIEGFAIFADKKAFILNNAKVEFVKGYNENHLNFVLQEVIPESISEFTGLTDKNGKKIFEWDIVILPKDVRKACVWNDNAFIKYVDGEFRYVPTPKNNSVNCWEVRICDSNKQLEVIGNIHDNSELLKGE